MVKYDIVYLLKNDYDSEELKYSLRSVCKNFPYRKIFFIGGKPEGITPDVYIEDEQPGRSKWEKSTHSLKLALESDEITENFWLFNDDFFVMNKVTKPQNYFNGSLEKRIADLRRKNIKGSAYIRELELLKSKLTSLKKDSLSFALHLPMLINKNLALRLFEKFPRCKMFRSFYGNYFEIECSFTKDVKVYDNTSVPNTDFLSTSDESFKDGTVGEFIRACFPDPCKYEDIKEEKSSYLPERYTEDGDEIIS